MEDRELGLLVTATPAHAGAVALCIGSGHNKQGHALLLGAESITSPCSIPNVSQCSCQAKPTGTRG